MSTSTQFQPTAQNMVQEVKNIIEGYRMGALRALAQDPVQNSLDAREGNNIVKVEYCLHQKQSRQGTPVWMLTVTDSGTSGLSGKIMTLAELQSRHYRLNESERWAAFEAQGFTKSGNDNIGSRGQGKSAFLYQSKVPPPDEDNEEERMLMLYDTLLPNGEYRLGVRFASPADIVRTPLINQDARSTVSSDFFQVDETIDPDLEVPLALQPLTEVGTRVIVPFLRHETAMDIIKGTLSKWIERCWWRPIQKGELQVSIKRPNSENTENIGIPEWWMNEPWQNKQSTNIMEFQALAIDDTDRELQINRLVLLHQENLEAPEELHSTIPEYSGIQLLRHGQWVETLGAKSEFPDIIPFAHRDQFRGFVEFNEELDRRLRDIERPQHDSFDGRFTEVKQILATIESCVRQFARTQGWPIADETNTNENDVPDSQLMSNIISSFISPNRNTTRPNGNKGGKTDNEPVWTLNFDAQYPNNDSRINWQQSLTALSARCRHESKENDLWANIRLQIKGTTGRYQTIQQRYVPIPRTETMILFDDLQVVAHKTRNATDAPTLECPSPGKYTLKSAVIWNGKEVATQTMPFFVEEDPPPPPERNKQSIAFKIKNNTTGNELTSSPSRIRNRDILEISIIATNRDYTETHCELDASIRATVANEENTLLLADEQEHILPAAIPGSSGAKQEILNQKVQIFTEKPTNKPNNQYVILPPGRHRVSADLFIIASNEPPAHAAKNLYVEVDPTTQSANMPFRFNPIDTATAPLWELKEENIGSGEWTLNYNRSNELYKQTVGASASMKTKLAFYGHICVEALIDWAMIPYLERRDESNLDILRDSAQAFNNADLTERYLDEIQKLVDKYGTTSDPSEYAIAFNECRRNMGGIMNNVLRRQEQQ